MSNEPHENRTTQRSDVASRPGVPGERTLVEGLLHYTGIVWRQKWLIAGLTAVAAVGSVVFAIISLRLPPDLSPLPNVYQADAVLLQQRSGTSQSVSATIMASLGMETGGGGLDYGQIAIAVLTSRDFIDRIADLNGIVERYRVVEKVRTTSRQIVLANSTFGSDPRTGMLRITYSDISPEFAAQMAGSIVDELILWFAARGGTDRLLAVQTLEDKLVEVEDRIREIEGEIEGFQRRYGVLRVEEIAQTQSDLLSGFQMQLLELDLQISNLQDVSRIENDPELLSLRARRQNVLNLMARIRAGYAGSNTLLPPSEQLPGLAAEYSRLQMDLGIQGRIYQALSERYEVAKLTADTDPAFTILVPVEVPEEKSGPSRGQLVIGMTAGGFFAGIALALLIHGVSKIVKDPAKRRILAEGAE